MNRCTNCNYENVPTSTFCERCGTPLVPTSSPLEPTYRASDGTLIPIPPPPPLSSYQHSPVALPQDTSHKRTVGRTILSLFFYLWGVLCLSFGLAILLNPSSTIAVLVFFVSCIVGLVILILLLLFRKYLYLGTRRRLLLEIGLTLIGFLFLIFFVSVLASSSVEQGLVFFGVFCSGVLFQRGYSFGITMNLPY